jgi:DNA-binding LytR/AlgR family response regulator
MNQENITIAIVDDETIFRVLTRNKLEEVTQKIPFSFTIREFPSGEDFLETKESFDIVFMDIAMPELSGIETAERYRKYCPNGILIFLTAFEDYMKEGYKVHAFRYLGKQDSQEDFAEAVRSAMLILQEKQKLRLSLINGGEIYLALEDIVYIEAQARSVIVHTRDDFLPVRGKISELTEMLEKRGFYLTHRAFLVNMQYVRSCVINEVMLSTMETIPLSERRYGDFKKQLHNFNLPETEV